MPELVEQMYCSQQIVIPPKYPYILKRYCKAAIKTQPYDLLCWSFQYFKALAEHRQPPVKLRLEYPIYSTEGGLTRGCLKVLAHQLYGMTDIPSAVLRQAWQGFCLDPLELNRILCLCDVYMRSEEVPFFHFIAVAGGMLTKCLTHTMILLCETLTKEPDGGSAAIPVEEFLTMYCFLAKLDASQDVQYHDGYREGTKPESVHEEAEEESESEVLDLEEDSDDNYWEDDELRRVHLVNDRVSEAAKISQKMNRPILGWIKRSPSMELLAEMDREKFDNETSGRPEQDDDIDKKLKLMSSMLLAEDYDAKGEPKVAKAVVDTEKTDEFMPIEEDTNATEEAIVLTEAEKIQEYLDEIAAAREERLLDLEQTFDEIRALVDKFKTVNYDLGMVAGRQMSTTSGEFIVQTIEREILEYIDDQIAILPDPNLKKKKAKPEEVRMIIEMLAVWLVDTLDVIITEVEEVEEEETPLPVITVVYAVPGIGAQVSSDIIEDFVEYINEVCKVQADTAMPRNIRHFLCPPLEKYVEPDYSANVPPPKEEVATGGKITE